ncbi:hypothetical protein N0V86_000453 [Didymella sp. IMI 355093]|nr:hypothetical protein N0V86_000453 [Didymella sp. IMI 355093]
MELKRASTPPPSEDVSHGLMAPPLTPGAPLPRTIIPPSPGGYRLEVLAGAASSRRPAKIRAPPLGSKRSLTVGVRKPAAKVAKTRVEIVDTVDKGVDSKNITSFMDLPGEIRNLIYTFTGPNSRQALLVHRPRLASLRSRTQLDRHRTLPSDIVEREQDTALLGAGRHGRTSQRKHKSGTLARETNRPFFGLTQVCRLLRQEFRPIFMQRQEIGIDLVDIVRYLEVFYSDSADRLKALSTVNDRKLDMPFTGNLTIAVGDKIKDVEKVKEGIDVFPLLDLWANSFKIEAGFGRYMQVHYDATADGEAKDLYRLFGRHVQPDRRCSAMNVLWRSILRTRSLASVRIYRQPAGSSQTPTPAPASRPIGVVRPVAPASRPYIHILFNKTAAEAWMTKLDAPVPQGWLAARGFASMEYFDIKVGVASASTA